jgi:hypothetical protein
MWKELYFKTSPSYLLEGTEFDSRVNALVVEAANTYEMSVNYHTARPSNQEGREFQRK